jgi:hypothetical protein
VHAAPFPRIGAHVGFEGRALELRDAEHQGHRLHQPVGAPDLARRAGLHRHVAVAGAVDDDFRAQGERPGLGLEDHAFAARQHPAREGVEQELNPGLVEELERDQLEPLRVERHDIAGLKRRRNRPARAHQALEQAPEHAVHHGLARAVVGGQECGGAFPFRSRLLRVERHERHDERGGGVAAEEAVALGEHHLRARVGRGDCRAEPGRPAADHQHIGFSGQERLPGRQRQPDGLVRPL